jgi:ubiquinone/menaquinone biosynthesis C-methylase UbiE
LNLGAGAALDLAALLALTAQPPLFAPHDNLFWNDPYISEQMLAAHLDPSTDAASRRPETIDRTVEWIIRQLGLRPGQRVLDLGCGPGLYCERLARRGLEVVGIDFSPRSIEHAQQRARKQSLAIDYVVQDYTRLDRDAEFDAALLIYLDFGVLSNDDRDEVLRRVRRALRSGGAFVFDARAAPPSTEPDGAQSWVVSPGGFWKPGPYLELTQHYWYPDADAKVRQTVVVEANGKVSRYRIWEHWYTPETIARVLAAQGFAVDSIWGGLTGQPLALGSPDLGVIARSQPRL